MSDSSIVTNDDNNNRNNNLKKPFYKRIKVPSSITIVSFFLIFSLLLTWIPHGTWYDYHNQTLSSGIWTSQAVVFDPTLTFTVDDVGKVFFNGLELPSNYWEYSSSSFWYVGYDSLGNITPIQGLPAGANWFYEMPWYANIFGMDGSWFIPENGTYGILNLFLILPVAFFSALPLITYIFAIVMFIEVLMISGTLESGIKSLMEKMKEKEIVLVPILFIVMALGGTIFGMQGETVALIPILVPFLVIAGFDTFTGLIILVAGTTTGMMSSIVNPFSSSIMAAGLDSDVISVGLSTGIGARVVVFFIYTSLGATLVTIYASRVKRNKDKSFAKNEMEEDIIWARNNVGEISDKYNKISKKQIVALIIFLLTFVFMIISLLPWTQWFNVGQFWYVFSSYFYSGSVIGEWYFLQLSLLFFAMTILLISILKIEKNKLKNGIKSSIKSVFPLLGILVISQGISVVLTYSGLTNYMAIKVFSGIDPNSLNPITFSLILFPLFLVLSIFIPSTSALASATAPTLSPMIDTIAVYNPDVAYQSVIAILIVYPLASGIINMFTPTFGLVPIQSEMSNIRYTKTLKVLGGYSIFLIILSFVLIPLIMLGVTNFVTYPF